MNIFINYRRADSAYETDRLVRALSKYLQKPKKQLYMDIESTQLGVDYIKVIAEKIAECDVMLTMIGEQWLVLKRDNQDVPRIKEEGDLVKEEIRTALEAGKPVVPTLFDGATFLNESDLPDDISNLARRNGISIERITFDEDVHRLAEALGLTKDNGKYGVFKPEQAPLLGAFGLGAAVTRKLSETNKPNARNQSAKLAKAGTSSATTGSKLLVPLMGIATVAVVAIGGYFTLGPGVNDGSAGLTPTEWTPWRSTDSPSGDGDFETIAHWTSAGTPACDKPKNIECRVMGTNVDWKDAGQVYHCNITEGAKCRNADQSGEQCHNYEVRYECPVD